MRSLLELCNQDESMTLAELFGSRASKRSFTNYIGVGEGRSVAKFLENLSDVFHLRIQQIEYAEQLSRATSTQLGSVLEHKYDWPSRGLTKAKVGDISFKKNSMVPIEQIHTGIPFV